MIKFFAIPLFLYGSFLINAQSKIAHLNSQEVMLAMPSYKQAAIDLEEFQKELEIELQAMIKNYQESAQIFFDKRDGLPPIRIQFEEEKLAKKEQDINERQQAVQMEIEAYSRELNYPIIMNVEKAVNIVADRHNYDYVFDVSTLMISKGPDITKEVITEALLLENAPPPKEEINDQETQP